MPFNIGLPELLVVLLIALLIFGANRVPQLFKGLGEGIRNFKTALKDEKPPEKTTDKEEPRP